MKCIDFAKFDSPVIIAALSLGCVFFDVQAAENTRLLQFSSQSVGAAASSVTVNVSDGSMDVTPYSGENFIASDHTYVARNPGFPAGTTYKVIPNNTLFYQVGVGDQRTSSTQYISAKCINPANLTIDFCNLGDEALFPRTFNSPGGGAYFQQAQVIWNSSSKQLEVTTPGVGNIQSTGLLIKMTPYVREITFQANNSGASDFVYGDVQVADAPSVTKAFAPASVQPGGRSILTISLRNPDLGVVVPGVNMTDALPSPLRIVSATHSCQGGSLTAAAGSSTINLSNTSIPISGCQITAEVEWPSTTEANDACRSTPTITNTITPPSQFSTAIGQLGTPATAVLNCTGATTPVIGTTTAIPALDGVGLLATSGMLGAVAAYVQRRRTKKANL
jgi:hypothetical protein